MIYAPCCSVSWHRAANATQIFAVKQIGIAILPQRQQESHLAAGRPERYRRHATQIEIVVIQLLPVARCEYPTGIAGMSQIRPHPEYTLPILPASCSPGIARREVERSVSLAQTRGRPDAALRRSRCPRAQELRWIDAKGDNSAMIIATIAVVAAERDEDAIIQQGQRAALALNRGLEVDAARGEPCGNVDREVGQHAAIGEPQAVEEVPWCATIVDHRIEIHGATIRIDHRCPRDAERVNIAARHLRPRNGTTEPSPPDDVAGRGVQPIDEIALGGGNYETAFCTRWPPVQRLRIDMPFDRAIELLNPADVPADCQLRLGTM